MNTQNQTSSVPLVPSAPSEARCPRCQHELALAKKAIAYTLQRIKSEPNIGYHMGFGTEVFERLTQAYSTLFREDIENVAEKFIPHDTGRMPAAQALSKINQAYQEYIGGYDQSDSGREALVTTLGEILRKTE